MSIELQSAFGALQHWHPDATDASIRAAANAAIAAGGGVINLPAGQITLTAPLPLADNICYRGFKPKISKFNNAVIDQDVSITGGTRLIGDGTVSPLAAGTFSAFQRNDAPQASLLASWNGLSGVSIEGMSLEGFKRGISLGNYNNASLANSSIRDIIVARCPDDWGVWLVNYHHCIFEDITTIACAKGQYKACLAPQSTCMFGNTTEIETYNYAPQASEILIDPLHVRKLVWSAGAYDGVTTAKLNELMVIRPQSSARYSMTQLSVSATLTSGSANIVVPDSTKFAPGMPLRFSAAVGGFRADEAYFVKSIVDATTITVSSTPAGSAVSATASGSGTITSYGFPCFELTAENSAGAVQSSTFIGVDFEGLPEIGVLFFGATQVRFDINEISSTSSTHLCFRSSQVNVTTQDNAGSAAIYDADSTSSTLSRLNGARGNCIQYTLAGVGVDWRDPSNPIRFDEIVGSFLWQGGSSLRGSTLPQRDRYSRQFRSGLYNYEATATGQRQSPLNTTSNVGDVRARVGRIIFNGASGQTFTLPTIVTDTTPALSHVGMEIIVANVSANALTVNTSSSQTINTVSGLTSVSVAAKTETTFIACKDAGGALFWLAKDQALRVA